MDKTNANNWKKWMKIKPIDDQRCCTVNPMAMPMQFKWKRLNNLSESEINKKINSITMRWSRWSHLVQHRRRCFNFRFHSNKLYGSTRQSSWMLMPCISMTCNLFGNFLSFLSLSVFLSFSIASNSFFLSSVVMYVLIPITRFN